MDRRKLDQVRSGDRRHQAYSRRCQAAEPSSADEAALNAYQDRVVSKHALTPFQRKLAKQRGLFGG